MEKLVYAFCAFAAKTDPSCQTNGCSFATVNKDKRSVSFFPFKREQVERILKLKKEDVEASLKKAFDGAEFDVSGDRIGHDKSFFILPHELSGSAITHALVLQDPALIELSFKNSTRMIEDSEREKYLSFIKGILGENPESL
jgi:hypothetical protein